MRLARLPLVVIGPAEAHAVFEPNGRPAVCTAGRGGRLSAPGPTAYRAGIAETPSEPVPTCWA